VSANDTVVIVELKPARIAGDELVLTRRYRRCHSAYVTAFNFKLRRGLPIVDQVVLAAIGAVLRGEYLTGQPFPSVRSIAADLKIHPNTAHKAVQHLIEEKWLETHPGVGTVVADRAGTRRDEWRRLLDKDLERLSARAHSIDVSLPDVIDALTKHWNS
jgi:GntR family transcriptional regulator